MTELELRNDIETKLTPPVTQASKVKELFNSTVDFILGQNKDDFPDWTSLLVFNTNGTGAGKYCKHPDINGRKRIFETKTSGNVNNAPPTDPVVTENTHWKEISESASSGIPEYAPGVFGSGLKIVYHNHTTLGRRLFLLTEPVRPFTSSNIETEFAAGKWVDFTLDKDEVVKLINAAIVGLYDDRGNHDASSNLFPAANGSGAGGVILKGDIYTISVAGVLGGQSVNIRDQVRALVDNPGQTSNNWAITEGNIGYVPQRVDAIASTGVAIQFDQPRTYGRTTPETGNITLNATGAQDGQVALIRHNSGTAPTFGSEFKRIGGSYVTGQLNFIFCTYVSPTEILYTVSQVQA
ncbi:MAG: hypothetical protein O9340_04385 [Cyclobacteriaceae bacterium]|nr:hypothetical protein [Cyclobacteriaceae bacterium]